ncbi:MAG: hypothetical protein KF709_01960 [Gemmatimonadaceae bacterium]|nr:hypothetical protein [Gemmatimonadaceae bacterium]
MSTHRRFATPLLLLALAVFVPGAAGAQAHATDSSAAPPLDPRSFGVREQARFESFRRAHLPFSRGASGSRCEEVVGRFCYWYDETAAPVPEPAQTAEARGRLLVVLDSLVALNPTDTWLTGQLVRYLDEDGKGERALDAARACKAFGWWCDALQGFALHRLGRYRDAEHAFDRLLEALPVGERCRWTDISLYLDEDSRRQYQRSSCGSEQREAFERRTWWLSRVRYGIQGNDSRTEHFARLTYVEFLRGAVSAYPFGFDEDERELVLRFGWPDSWSRGPDAPMGLGGPAQLNVVGSEPTPAYRYIPPHHVLTSPIVSDSIDWAVQLPPVVARYHPPYAKQLVMLEHQQALFRRGDTALVVLAYDVGDLTAFTGTALEGSLTLSPGGEPREFETVARDVPATGRLTARAPWGPLLMSAEIAAPARSALARARYGVRPPYAVGTRVALSDLLFYKPYGELPSSVEQAIPHALSTQRVPPDGKLGVYWEVYNTNPSGERLSVSLTIVPETEEAGFFRRGLQALRLAKESAPVSLSVEDVSTRGAPFTARALELDISTLRPGDYLVQLEIGVEGQFVLRTDRRLVVVAP